MPNVKHLIYFQIYWLCSHHFECDFNLYVWLVGSSYDPSDKWYIVRRPCTSKYFVLDKTLPRHIKSVWSLQLRWRGKNKQYFPCKNSFSYIGAWWLNPYLYDLCCLKSLHEGSDLTLPPSQICNFGPLTKTFISNRIRVKTRNFCFQHLFIKSFLTPYTNAKLVFFSKLSNCKFLNTFPRILNI